MARCVYCGYSRHPSWMDLESCTRCGAKRAHIGYRSIVGTRWCRDGLEAVEQRGEPIELSHQAAPGAAGRAIEENGPNL